MIEELVVGVYNFTGVLFLCCLLLSFVLESSIRELRTCFFSTWFLGGFCIVLQIFFLPDFFGIEMLAMVSMIAYKLVRSKPPEFQGLPYGCFKMFALCCLAVYVAESLYLIVNKGVTIIYLHGGIVVQVFEDVIFYLIIRRIANDCSYFRNVLSVAFIMAWAHVYSENWMTSFSLVFIVYLPMWGLLSFRRVGFLLIVSYHYMYNLIFYNMENSIDIVINLTIMACCCIFAFIGGGYQKEGQSEE